MTHESDATALAGPSLPLEFAAARDVVIRKLETVAPLSEDDRSTLRRALGHQRSVHAHVTIMHPGEVPTTALVVLRGVAACLKLRPGGQRQILNYLFPGDLYDLDLALVGNTDVSIETISPCRIASIPLEDFGDMLEGQPQIDNAFRLCKLTDEAMMRERMVGLGSRSALERTAHLLCELLARLQVVGLATRDGCDLPLTQTDLANTLGLSTIHINRTLQALRSNGLIALKGGKLTLLDIPRLHALAEFFPVLPVSRDESARNTTDKITTGLRQCSRYVPHAAPF